MNLWNGDNDAVLEKEIKIERDSKEKEYSIGANSFILLSEKKEIFFYTRM
jgi:hypothetical protein